MLNLVLVAVAMVLALALRAPWGPLHLHFATVETRFRTARRGPQRLAVELIGAGIHLAERFDERPPSRPIRNPFATSDPLSRHRAVTGLNAHVRWYQRVSSLVGIVLLVALMGVLVAVAIGVAFFAARIVLELLVG